MEGSEERLITRVKGQERLAKRDLLAVEKPLRVRVNGRELFKLYCSPVMIKELVAGFIMTEGILRDSALCEKDIDIAHGPEEIVVDIAAPEGALVEGRGAITSGCAGGLTYERYESAGEGGADASAARVFSGEALREAFGVFGRSSALYRLTGCVHSAALWDGEKRIILFQAEDVGRHNAVDKVIGAALFGDVGLGDKILLSSGRLSAEIAGKCARWRIPALASHAAPTSRAVDIAERAGITLVGFLRGGGFNIYAHPQRILP